MQPLGSVCTFFVSPRKAFTCFLRGDFPFYTFYTFYNVINERVNYINTYTTYFCKFLQNQKEKLSKYLIDKYEKLDDTLEFDELLDQLGELYGVYIGDIYDITEF